MRELQGTQVERDRAALVGVDWGRWGVKVVRAVVGPDLRAPILYGLDTGAGGGGCAVTRQQAVLALGRCAGPLGVAGAQLVVCGRKTWGSVTVGDCGPDGVAGWFDAERCGPGDQWEGLRVWVGEGTSAVSAAAEAVAWVEEVCSGGE